MTDCPAGEPPAGITRVAPDAVVITRVALLDEPGTVIAVIVVGRF